MCDVKGKVGSSFSGCWNFACVDVSITVAHIFVSIAAVCRATHGSSAHFCYRQAHATRAGYLSRLRGLYCVNVSLLVDVLICPASENVYITRLWMHITVCKRREAKLNYGRAVTVPWKPRTRSACLIHVKRRPQHALRSREPCCLRH